MDIKEQKRIDAQVRQEAYDALTPLEKLARLDARPGNAARERARIAKQQEAGQ